MRLTDQRLVACHGNLIFLETRSTSSGSDYLGIHSPRSNSETTVQKDRRHAYGAHFIEPTLWNHCDEAVTPHYYALLYAFTLGWPILTICHLFPGITRATIIHHPHTLGLIFFFRLALPLPPSKNPFLFSFYLTSHTVAHDLWFGFATTRCKLRSPGNALHLVLEITSSSPILSIRSVKLQWRVRFARIQDFGSKEIKVSLGP